MASADTSVAAATVEWPPLGLIMVTYCDVGGGALLAIGPVAAGRDPVMAWARRQHSSLTHEVLHGHRSGPRR